MKNKINLLLTLFLVGLGLGVTQQVNSATLIKVKGGTIYYDNSKTNWSEVALFIGRDWDSYNHTKVFTMSHIDHTKLYYANPTYWCDDSQEKENPNYIRFTACTSWGTGDWGSENYNCSNGYTNIYRSTYTFDVNHWYIFTPSSGSNNTSISIENRENGQDYGRAWNRDQCLHARLSQDGGSTFSAPTKSPAFLRVEGYAFNAYNTCNSNGGDEIAAGANYEMQKTGVGYTATVKMIVKNVASGVTFLGFYDGSGKQLKSAADAAQGQEAGQYVYEYMMYSFDNGNVYARFTEPVYEVTLTGFADAKVSNVGPFTTGSATLKVPAGKEYSNYSQTNLTNVSKVDNTFTFNATAAGTLTAVYTYKTPQIACDNASYQIGGAAIKLNPTYTDVADDATYTWSGTNVTFSSTDVPNPNVSVETAGDYTITVVVKNGGSDSYKASKTITLTASEWGGNDCGTCFNYEQPQP